MLVDAVVRNLADVPLRCAQHDDPLLDQFLGRQRRMTRAVKADELGDVLEVLPEDKLIAFGNDRYITHAEREQLFASAAVVQHVDRDELDVSFRKKLFRSEAAASPWLGKE